MDPKHLDTIAAPIVHKMKMLHPTLSSKLESYVPIKLSLTLTLIVFVLNLLLHTVAVYLYHRCAILRKLTPKFLRATMMTHDSKLNVNPPTQTEMNNPFQHNINDKIPITESNLNTTLSRRPSLATNASTTQTFTDVVHADVELPI